MDVAGKAAGAMQEHARMSCEVGPCDVGVAVQDESGRPLFAQRETKAVGAMAIHAPHLIFHAVNKNH